MPNCSSCVYDLNCVTMIPRDIFPRISFRNGLAFDQNKTRCDFVCANFPVHANDQNNEVDYFVSSKSALMSLADEMFFKKNN